jgi:fumarate reductase iron-sulfur subunit
MNVNGTPTLTCEAFLRSFYPREIVVEPLASFPVIRHLVIDMSDFIHKLSAIKPWIIREHEKSLSEGEYLQTEEQIDEYHQYSACINCMLCYAACPVYGYEPIALLCYGSAFAGTVGAARTALRRPKRTAT